MKTLLSIELFGFQKHDNKKIFLTPTINVIVGSSDAGKSAFFKALRWVFTNDISTDAIRKVGSKETRVVLVYDDGVEIEKIKTNTLNRYIIRRGVDEKVFDSVGRDVPQEIIDYTNIDLIKIDKEKFYLNEAKQGEYFLLNEKPTVIGKLIDTLTGNSVISDIFKNINTKIMGYNKEIKRVESDIEQKDLQMTGLELERTDKLAIFNKVEPMIKSIEQLQQKISSIKLLNEKYNLLNKKIADIKLQQSKLVDYDLNKILNIKSNLEKFNALSLFKNKLNICEQNSLRIMNDLSKIKVVKININDLKAKLNNFDSLKELFIKLNICIGKLNVVNQSLSQFKSANIDFSMFKDKLNSVNNLKLGLQKLNNYDIIIKQKQTQIDSINFDDLLVKKQTIMSKVSVDCPKCSHKLGYDDLKVVI
jgi:chromosome segregation ATPase